MYTKRSNGERRVGISAAGAHLAVCGCLLLAGCAATPTGDAAGQDTSSAGPSLAEPTISCGRRLRCSGRPQTVLAPERPFITSQAQLDALTTCASAEQIDFTRETVVALFPGNPNTESIQVRSFEVDAASKTLVAKRTARQQPALGQEREPAPALLYVVAATGLEHLRDEVARAPSTELPRPQLP